MSGIAGYKLIRALRGGPSESSWVAVPPGGAEPTSVVERCEPVSACAVAGCDDALGLFLERRALQRRWAERIGDGPGGLGQGHVVPIRNLGVSEVGGFAVRDRYALSAGDLVRARTRLRGDVLLELVSGVVGALRAIESTAGRPHGDVSPETVLLRDLRPGRVRVGLRCPAAAGSLDTDPGRARRDELRRIGLLIHELVVHRPLRELRGYPIREDETWRALGPDHGFWLGLANDLLDPKNRTLTLDEVAKRLAGRKLRKPGPGPLVIGGWAAALVLVLAGVAGLLMMPRGSGPPIEDFKQPEFERWCRVTPGVLAFRSEIARLDGEPPVVLAEAEALLDAGLEEFSRYEDLKSLFDPNKTIQVAGYASPRDEGTKGLARRISEIEGFQERLALGEVENAEKRTEALDRVAGVYSVALRNLDGRVDGPPGLVAKFGGAHWPARRTLELRAGGWRDERGWSRAAGLVISPLERIDAAATVLRDGVDFGGEMGSFEARPVGGGEPIGLPVQAASLEAARSLVNGVGRIEALAKAAVEIDERVDALAMIAGELGARSRLEGLPGDVGAAIGRDPFLESLPGLVGAIGILDEDEGLDDLVARIDAVETAFAELRAIVVDGSWSGLGVDVLAMRSLLDESDAGWRTPAELSGDAGVVLSRLADRIDMCRRWADAARGAPALSGADLPSRRLRVGDGFAALRAKWVDPVKAAPGDSAGIAAEELAALLPSDAERTVEVLLAEGESCVALVEAGPHWASRRDVIEPAVERANTLARVLDEVIASVRAQVLKKPDEVYAEWRAGKTLDESARVVMDRLGVLGGFRAEQGEAMYAEWRAWFDALSPPRSMDEANKDPVSKRYHTSVNGLEGVISRAAVRAVGVAEAYRVEAFEWGPIEDAVLDRLGEVIRDSLAGVGETWGEKEAGEAGGEIDLAVAGAIEAERERLGALRDDLAMLAVVRDGLGRCELPGSAGTPDAAALSELLGALEGPHARFVASSGGVRAAMETAGAVLDLLSSGDLGGVVSRVVDAGAGPHRAERYAGLIRAGELAAGGAVWPSGVGEMRADADRLVRAMETLRSELEGAPGAWGRVSARARAVIADWWARGFEVAEDERDLGVLVEEAPGWFATLGEGWDRLDTIVALTGSARYDAEAYRIRAGILADARETMRLGETVDEAELLRLDEGLRGRTVAALDRLRELGRDALADVGVRSAVSDWIGVIEGEIAEAEAGRAGWDENDHGPAGVDPGRWRGELGEHADGTAFVTYTNGGLSIRFHLLELADGQKVFLSEDEFSVRLLKAIAPQLKMNDEPALRAWLGETTPNSSKSVLRPEGPRAQRQMWNSNRPRLRVVPSEAWLDHEDPKYGPVVPNETYPAYPDPLRSSSGWAMINESQGKPGLDHPVGYVTFDAARAIARAVGCRLPTIDEFGRALDEPLPSPESGVWNLRDGVTYPAQRKHYEEAVQNGVPIYEPGQDCYDERVREGDPKETWEYGGGGGSAESKLWFEVTGPGAAQPGVRFRHLIGNVAEFVLESDDRPGGGAAMGASALSHPSVLPGRVVTGLGSVRGYADTGFRLAIDADNFGSLAKAIERVVVQSARDAFTFGGG